MEAYCVYMKSELAGLYVWGGTREGTCSGKQGLVDLSDRESVAESARGNFERWIWCLECL